MKSGWDGHVKRNARHTQDSSDSHFLYSATNIHRAPHQHELNVETQKWRRRGSQARAGAYCLEQSIDTECGEYNKMPAKPCGGRNCESLGCRDIWTGHWSVGRQVRGKGTVGRAEHVGRQMGKNTWATFQCLRNVITQRKHGVKMHQGSSVLLALSILQFRRSGIMWPVLLLFY